MPLGTRASSVSRLALLLGLLALIFGTVELVRMLDRSGYGYRPPRERPFEPSSPLVTLSSIGGVEIGESRSDAFAAAGKPTEELDLPASLTGGMPERRADYEGAELLYDDHTRKITQIDALFSSGIRTPYGDRTGTSKQTVLSHYPTAVSLTSRCTRYYENVVLRAKQPGYFLDFWFTRGALQGVTLTTWPQFTYLCSVLARHGKGVSVPRPPA